MMGMGLNSQMFSKVLDFSFLPGRGTALDTDAVLNKHREAGTTTPTARYLILSPFLILPNLLHPLLNLSIQFLLRK